MSHLEEEVLVVPTEVFHQLSHFQGFSADADRYREGLLQIEHFRFLPRSAAEDDPSHKQLIPYVIFCWRDGAGEPHLFSYTRGTGQGEGRLHRKRSVGIGGHISREDAGGELTPAAYEVGLRRELDEEVEINSPYDARLVGLINDDESEVGKVHLGLVHLYELTEPQIAPREEDIAEAGFRPVSELLNDLEGFETWSQYCIRALFATDK